MPLVGSSAYSHSFCRKIIVVGVTSDFSVNHTLGRKTRQVVKLRRVSDNIVQLPGVCFFPPPATALLEEEEEGGKEEAEEEGRRERRK